LHSPGRTPGRSFSPACTLSTPRRVRLSASGLFVASFGARLRAQRRAVGGLYLAGTLAAAVTLLFTGHWIDHVRLVYFSAVVVAGLSAACFIAAAANGPFTLFLAFYALRLTGRA
jgi:peptidoglycan/LPS O-acetylase OafA/YrhL